MVVAFLMLVVFVVYIFIIFQISILSQSLLNLMIAKEIINYCY